MKTSSPSTQTKRFCDYCNKELQARVVEWDNGTRHLVGWAPCDCPESMQMTETARRSFYAKPTLSPEEKLHREYEKAGIPPRFLEHQPDQQSFDLLAQCENGDGLYLQGTYGAFKSTLAAKIAMAAISQGKTVLFTSSMRIIGQVNSAMDGEGTIEGVFRQLAKPDILVIDDLGKNARTSSEHTVSMLYRVINERYEQLQTVIITSNFNKKELVERLTINGNSDHAEAIVSRLIECTKKVDLGNVDHRLAS